MGKAGQDLDREGRQQPCWGGRGTLRIQAEAHCIAVRLGIHIRAVGAQAQAPQSHHWAGQWGHAWAPPAVEAGLTEVRALGLESAEATWERG